MRTRRWRGFTALVVFAIIAFGLLSMWQWQRAEDKRDQRIELQSALAAAPQQLDEVAGGTVSSVDQFRHVTVTGTYLPTTGVVVRKRPLESRNGFWAMTALRTSDGSVVWVNRGWLPTTGDALSTPDVAPPPTGTVDVVGYLRSFEDADPDANSGLPSGQIAAPARALLPALARSFDGYIQLQTSDPAQDGLQPLPVPDLDESRNISYAVQWLLFAFVAIGGWFFFLRREAIDDARRASVVAGGV